MTAKHGPVASEIWHGSIFRENPIFTIARVTTLAGMRINLGENWIYISDDNTEQLCMIRGIAQDEDSADIKVFVRKYELGPQKRKRKVGQASPPVQAILTEQDEILSFDMLDTRLLRVASVQHEPSAHPAPGLMLYTRVAMPLQSGVSA